MSDFTATWRAVVDELGLIESSDIEQAFQQHFTGEFLGVELHLSFDYQAAGTRLVEIGIPFASDHRTSLRIRPVRVLFQHSVRVLTGHRQFDQEISVEGDPVVLLGQMSESVRNLLLLMSASFDFDVLSDRIAIVDCSAQERTRTSATVVGGIKAAIQIRKRLAEATDPVEALIIASRSVGDSIAMAANAMLQELALGKFPAWDSWSTRVRCLEAIEEPDNTLLQDAARYAPAPTTRIAMLQRLAPTWSEATDILDFVKHVGAEQDSAVKTVIAELATGGLKRVSHSLHQTLRLVRDLEGHSAAEALVSEVLGELVQSNDRKGLRKTFFEAEFELQRRFMSAARLLGPDGFRSVGNVLVPTVGFERRELLDDERTARLVIQWLEELPASVEQELALIELLHHSRSPDVTSLLIEVLGRRGAHRSYAAIKELTEGWDPTSRESWSVRAVLESMAERLDFDGGLSVSLHSGGDLTLNPEPGGLSSPEDKE